jgi:GNAT superfamily N-acetyltransferase
LNGEVIRPATPSDVSAVLQLIKELATYERSDGEVQTTEADIAASLFGPDPKVWALVAEEAKDAKDAKDAGEIVGLALYFLNYSTWTGRHGLYLEDLFVRPSHRGTGTGRALMAALAQEAARTGCARFEWAVLDWNESAIGFYRALGAEPQHEWTVYRLSGEALERLAKSSL